MIYLTGSNGMLGTEIRLMLQAEGMDFISSDIDVDITKYENILSFIGDRKPDWIINASAYTAVDKAEDDIEAAYAVNETGAGNLSRIAKELGTKLIHISTDYVFSGEKTGEYYENDTTGPTGVYGKSKLAGELLVREIYDNHFIIRISWLIGFYGRNFLYTMLQLMKDKQEIRVVNDQWGSPTFTTELSSFLINLIKSGSSKFGTYHYSSTGKTTWYDFAISICESAYESGIISKKPVIIPVSTENYPTKTKRPENSYLSKEKIMSDFSTKPNLWRLTLKDFIQYLVENKDRCAYLR